MNTCPLCSDLGGQLIYENDFIRAVNAGESAYPNFTRIILQQHVKEMTDLSAQDRARLMEYVYTVEQVQREILKPAKINLAQFGTVVPHLHWHIIPRFTWDLHYPQSFWSSPAHSGQAAEYLEALQEQRNLQDSYHQALIKALSCVA